jgi:hypothetical protein
MNSSALGNHAGNPAGSLSFIPTWAFWVAFGYFFMLALGPIPVFVAGVSIDRITSALLLCVLLIARLRGRGDLSTPVIWLIGLYSAAVLPSVLASTDTIEALGPYLVALGYALTLALFVSLKVGSENPIRWGALLGLLTAELLTLYLYYSSGYQYDIRFAVSINYDAYAALGNSIESDNIDPNMTAMGMMLCYCCALPVVLQSRHIVVRFISVTALFLMIYCILLLQSRTGLVMIGALAVVVIYHTAATNGLGRTTIPIAWAALLILTGLGLLSLIDIDVLDKAFERFDNAFENERENLGRLDMLEIGMDCYRTSLQTILLGCGFSWSNPHNEFVRALVNSGPIALVAFCFLVGLTYFYAREAASRKSQSAIYVDAIALPFMLAMLTYGHTKTLWVGLAIVWLSRLPGRRSPRDLARN